MRTFLLLLALAVAGLVVPPARAEQPAAVEAVKDIAYYDGKDADPIKHKLDLYLPKGKKDFPVLFFVHGGAWKSGDKKIYGRLGEVFARQGIGTVITNYRLSPQVKFPEHIKDVARAFAWVHKHIAEYGGDPSAVFACGHSAGGHLVALLVTDESYLKAEGLTSRDVRGVIPISGVYLLLPPLFASVFGDDPAGYRAASPLEHVREGLPPFLILYADGDYPTLGPMAERFGEALRKAKDDVTVLKIADRTHITIIRRMLDADDPAARAIVEFIGKHAARPPAAPGGK